MRVRNFFSDAQKPAHAAPSSLALPSSSNATTYTTFDDLVASYRMPPPGPEYFRARRQLWLTPRSDRTHTSHSTQATSAHKKLLDVLQNPEAAYSDACWRNGIEKTWKGLAKGDRLKQRLPLNLAIKVVHASWVRDGTWPAGMRAPEPDNEIHGEVMHESVLLEPIHDAKSHSDSQHT